MKFTTHMKRLTQILLTAFAVGAVQIASAMNYSAGHLLLVFRGGTSPNDVEIDLGSVSNYLGLATGTKVPISLPANINTNFNDSFNGVDFLLVAATGLGDPLYRVWETDANLSSTPNNLTLSAFSGLRSKIDSVGTEATANTASNSAPYIVSAANLNSYDSIVTGDTGISVPTMYGSSGVPPFPVEVASPTTLSFYQVQINPSQTPATLIGAFTMDVNGNLTFTAGQLPPLYSSTINGITSSSGSITVSFTTTNGINYQLQYSTNLNGGAWTPVAGQTTAGDGNVQSLFDFSTDPARFYRIQSNY
jgi:hypothetical protein